jgi:hypothetical protein
MIEEIIPVLEMMLKKGERCIGGAAHDVIYGPLDFDLTDEEIQILKDNGWHVENDCWCKFV